MADIDDKGLLCVVATKSGNQLQLSFGTDMSREQLRDYVVGRMRKKEVDYIAGPSSETAIMIIRWEDVESASIMTIAEARRRMAQASGAQRGGPRLITPGGH